VKRRKMFRFVVHVLIVWLVKVSFFEGSGVTDFWAVFLSLSYMMAWMAF